MRILLISASLPYPLASGGAIRTYGIIEGLSHAGHDITLLCYGEQDAANTPLNELCSRIEIMPPPRRGKIDRLKTLIFSPKADIATRFYSDHFRDKLISLCTENNYDLIQFEAIEIACFIPVVHELEIKAALCFDTFNAEAELQKVIYEIDRKEPRRWLAAAYSWIQSKRIAQYEADLCNMVDLVLAVSEEDHRILSAYRSDDRTKILSSGIFVDHYQSIENPIQLKPRSLVFTGKMDYRPNVDAMLWFSGRIMPHIKNAHLTIVGQKPHKNIQHLENLPNISITGWVDSVLPYLHATDVYIAPLRMGSGTRLKLLEAMAAGCAIIATTTAASGLSEEVRSAMLIVDTAQEFAQAINTLLDEPQQRQELGQLAQQIVREHYDWDVLIPRLLKIYSEVGLG